MRGFVREITTSLFGTIARTFDVAGRARRQEVAYFWLVWVILSELLRKTAGMLLDREPHLWADAIIGWVLIAPSVALFVRRLHDVDASGWIALAILPPLFLFNIYKSIRVNFHAFDPAWPDLELWSLILLIPAVASLIFLALPGTIGRNRFGPDPRSDKVKELAKA